MLNVVFMLKRSTKCKLRTANTNTVLSLTPLRIPLYTTQSDDTPVEDAENDNDNNVTDANNIFIPPTDPTTPTAELQQQFLKNRDTHIDDQPNSFVYLQENGENENPIWKEFEVTLNRIPTMAVYIRPRLGGLFLRGCISLKNWSYCPLLRHSTSPFKSTCLLIYLKEVLNR
jgi:hypothetical protein